ncbi:hypothetical protein [Azospira restricta]|uniref:Uncharacterized protein n=1 Tax=Azospira restricta TaxID=404405 RepID=A0A974SNU4_9RHOO|nr:hypothetical protein [Azospira restricta]QRJ63700.1 hypothetical protein IWH25_18500 [Azospira restricta]
MKAVRADLARLRASLAAVLALLAVGGGIAWLAERDLRQARSRHADAERLRAEFAGRLLRVRDEAHELRQLADRFYALRVRGIVGDERRPDWVALIGDLRRRRRLAELRYELSPQQPAAAEHAFRSSAMRLQMKLLHEGDLLGFIDDLRAQAQATVRVRSCTVRRSDRPAATPDDAAGLDADCTLEWITFPPPQEGT